MFKLNLEKAKDLHKNRIRLTREKIFNRLDIEFMKAVESGNIQKIEEIGELKQQLRDLPDCEEIENATCLNDLRSHWPDILEGDSPYNN